MLRRRRLLAAICAAGAVGLVVVSVRPPAPATESVLVAARDLPAGLTLRESDLRAAQFPAALVPSVRSADLVGHTLATPVRAGEVVTEVRVLGAALVTGDADRRAVPVRLPDADSASLLEPGVRIDIHATNANGRDSRLLAADVVVLAVPPTEHDGTREGRLVVLGVPEHLVADFASAGVADFLSYAFTG